jgi:hypothetical protein
LGWVQREHMQTTSSYLIHIPHFAAHSKCQKRWCEFVLVMVLDKGIILHYFTCCFVFFALITSNKIGILYPRSHLSWNGFHVFWKKIKGFMFYLFDIFLLMFITYYFQFQLNLVLFPTSQCDIHVHVLYLFVFLLTHYLNWLRYLHSIKCKIKKSI